MVLVRVANAIHAERFLDEAFLFRGLHACSCAFGALMAAMPIGWSDKEERGKGDPNGQRLGERGQLLFIAVLWGRRWCTLAFVPRVRPCFDPRKPSCAWWTFLFGFDEGRT